MTQTTQARPVPPNSVELALAHVRAGGRLIVRTCTRTTVISARTLASFEAAGEWVIKSSGEGYRLRRGKGSDYLMPGQLEMID